MLVIIDKYSDRVNKNFIFLINLKIKAKRKGRNYKSTGHSLGGRVGEVMPVVMHYRYAL